jgi:hypothetical protein
MNKELNKQLVTYCAVVLLFAGSLYYFVDVAFQNKDALMERQNVRISDDYFEEMVGKETLGN